jgi:hypothetical protein
LDFSSRDSVLAEYPLALRFGFIVDISATEASYRGLAWRMIAWAIICLGLSGFLSSWLYGCATMSPTIRSILLMTYTLGAAHHTDWQAHPLIIPPYP